MGVLYSKRGIDEYEVLSTSIHQLTAHDSVPLTSDLAGPSSCSL